MEELLIPLLVIGFVIFLIIRFWQAAVIITASVVAIYVINGIVKKRAEERRQREAAEARRRAEEAERLRQYRAQQQSYFTFLRDVCGQSIALFEGLPTRLYAAETALDQAGIDFAEGVFAPFWDSIEKAAIALARFSEDVQTIKNNALQYRQLIKVYAGTPPEFPLSEQSIAKLGVGTASSDRMKAIVRKAQRNFHFASIYEQRKTNQILIAGFQSLAHALEHMTQRISSSIGELATSVHAMSSSLHESTSEVQSQLGQIVDINAEIAATNAEHYNQLSKDSKERVSREKKALEMLDNIQRGRRPFF